MPFNRPIPQPKQGGKIASGVGAIIEAEKAMQMALMLPSSVFIGWLAGAWADYHFHQSWISIAGVVFGSVSGVAYIVRTVITAEKNSRPAPDSGNETGKGNEPQQP